MLFKDIKPTMLIDISCSEEDLWKNIDRSRRKNVNRAKREGLKFKEGNSEEIAYFYNNIYKKVWEDGGTIAESFESILNKIKNGHKFYVVEIGLDIIGGAIVGEETKGRLNFSIVGSNPKYSELRPTDFMYWNLILIGKRENKKFVDFNGYQLNARGHLEGVNRFKSMWGGKIHIDYVFSKNPFYILGRKVYRNMWFIRPIVDILRGRKLKQFAPDNN